MVIINALIVILIPWVFGLFLLSLFLQKGAANFGTLEKLALAFPLGLGFITLIMFFYGVAGIPITLATILTAIFAIVLTALGYLFRAKTFCLQKEFKLKPPKLNAIEMLLLGLITLKVVYVFFSSIIKPLVDVDAFQQYSIVAKAIFYNKTFTLPYLYQFIQDKPLFPYLSQGWAFLGLQAIDDSLFKILTPFLFLCLLIIFNASLQKYYSRIHSLLFTFLLSTLPFLVFHVTTAYADFPQTFYYAVATIYLFRFMKDFAQSSKESSLSALILSFIFLGLTVWVKRAGIFLAGINLVVFAFYLFNNRKLLDQKILKNIGLAFLIFILITAPWIIYGQAQTFIGTFKQLSPVPGKETTAAAGPYPISKTDIVLSTLLRKLFLYGDWNLLWLLFVTTLIFYYKRALSRPLIFLLAIIILDISALFSQFRFGASFIWILDGTLLDRLVMNYVPVVLYFCAEAIIPSFIKL